MDGVSTEKLQTPFLKLRHTVLMMVNPTLQKI